MEWFRGFLYFSKQQLRAVFVLLILIIIAALLPYIFDYFFPPRFDYNEKISEQAMLLEQLLAKNNDTLINSKNNPRNREKDEYKRESIDSGRLFMFDPNKIGAKEWVQLGFSPKQAEAIEKIKGKGFIFYKPEDLRKIYVIGEAGYERLKSYVQIENKSPDLLKHINENKSPISLQAHQSIINLNTADSATLEKLPGIGPYLARRICAFRNALGGFVSVEQLKEVRGLPDTTFQKIRSRLFVGETTIRKLNINTLPVDSLAAHPYISQRQAQQIIAFRNMHGKFSKPQDIQKAVVMPDSVFEKLQRYLTTE
ncbi:MAG: helix-hairpin-helix domain-containing protein [Chitinophagales bacterium]|nr:helix-hairpin-helix domain-containing protein [Chitinophagales bacterium]